MIINKPRTFTNVLAAALAILVMVILVVADYLFSRSVNFGFVLVVGILFYASGRFIIQGRTEKYIYRQIKLLYENVSILDVKDISKDMNVDNIEQLSSDLLQMAEERRQEIESLRDRESFRREFIGNLAHEMKTPLFTVQGYLLTLLEGGIDDEKLRNKYLKRANKGVDRLIAVVKDLDAITRLETGEIQLNRSDFNMVDLVDDIFELLEIKAKKANIELSFDHEYLNPIMVNGDEEKLEQVVTNLLANSINYGNDGGRTVVRFYQEGHKLMTEVKDDGIGMEAADVSRIFERFYRVDKSRSREQGGSGLGLAIVKHILEAHDEKITAESTPDQGSTFTFSLELAE